MHTPAPQISLFLDVSFSEEKLSPLLSATFNWIPLSNSDVEIVLLVFQPKYNLMAGASIYITANPLLVAARESTWIICRNIRPWAKKYVKEIWQRQIMR